MAPSGPMTLGRNGPFDFAQGRLSEGARPSTRCRLRIFTVRLRAPQKSLNVRAGSSYNHLREKL
jgi:hypothetical protein